MTANQTTALPFESLLEYIEQAVIATDLTGSIIYWNRFAETLYGWTSQEAIGQNIVQLVPTNSSQEHAEEIMDALRAGQRWSGEFTVKRRDGTSFVSFVTDAPVFDAAGTLIAIVGISHDVTARHEADRRQQRQAEIIRTIAEISRQLSAELDLQKLVQGLTDAATRIAHAEFGAFFYNVLDNAGESYMLYTLSGVSRESFSRFPMPRNTAVFAPTFHGTGIVRSDDIRLDERYGKSAPYFGIPPGHLPVVSYLAVPVISRGGEVFGGIFLGHSSTAVFTEDTEEIVAGLAAQASICIENARLYEQAVNDNIAKDEFLATVSHELRTPLTAILGWARFLRERDLDPETARLGIETIERSARSQARLVDELLDMSRIVTRKLQLTMLPVDLAEIGREVLQLFEPEADAKRIRMTTTFPSSTPIIVGDAPRLQQVMTNLIANAIKFTEPEGSVHLEIGTRDDSAVINVSDDGCGIAPEFLPFIFDRLRQAPDTSGRQSGGLGLGLAITKYIVERHGGRITAESDGLGKGTRLEVTLPLVTSSR